MVRRTAKPPSGRQGRPAQPASPADKTLVETLDLNAATGLRDTLLALRGGDLALDASAVQFLGTPCAQVLATAALGWKADGAAFTISPASEPFRRGVRLLGLDSLLNPDRIGT